MSELWWKNVFCWSCCCLGRRSCFGHNLGAKSLVAAVQLHLRVRAAWASNWPHGHPSLLLRWSCWALRGKTEVLTWNLSIGKGRPGYSNAALPPLMPSSNLGCWTVLVTSHFYFHLTASSTCVILKYLLYFLIFASHVTKQPVIDCASGLAGRLS